jgi:N,N-dimethylformamidase beta subunit-like protein
MDVSPNPLAIHKVFLSLGHDEYWSKGERDNVESAIASGVNVAFFGANDSYWQIRYEPDSHGNPYRTEVGYKDYATDITPPGPDPQWGVNNAIVTTNWRDPVVNRPENSMIGIMYEDQLSTTAAAYIVQNASNWVYANTGFTNGTSVPGIVGYEYDRVFDNGLTPTGLTVLSKSPVNGLNVGNSYANSSIYTAPSSAQVFAAGTIEWSWGLDNFGGRTTANTGIQQTTANIMYRFSGETPPPPPPPLPAGVYFTDNFESGNLTLWNGPNGLGTAQAESTVVNSGAFGAAIANQSGQYTYLTAQLSGAQASTYTRFYFRVASPGPATATLAQGRDASNHTLWSVTYDAGRKGIDAYFWNGARGRFDVYSNTNLVAANTWYTLEIEFNESSTGHAEIWLNGTSIAAADGDMSSASGYANLALVNEVTGTTYFDDVKVANVK